MSSREKIWKIFFPNEEMPPPNENAFAESQGILGRLLPEGTELDLTEEIRRIRRRE